MQLCAADGCNRGPKRIRTPRTNAGWIKAKRRLIVAMLDDKVKQQLGNLLKNMKDSVNIAFFTQEFECQSCRDVRTFIEEFSSLSDKIKLSIHDFVKDKSIADRFAVDKIPAIVINDKDNNDRGIKFYGLPGGYEINSFIISLLEVSGNIEPLKDDIASRIKAIDKDVHIQVYVTLTCPYCPTAVSTAHRLAIENKKIKADMIDAGIFAHLTQKYQVSGVPRIIINESHNLVGAQPIEKFLDVIEKL
jgi:glutaredoxin-like protein